MNEHHVEMFTADSFLKPDPVWGWQCFTCPSERSGFASLAAAERDATAHAKATL